MDIAGFIVTVFHGWLEFMSIAAAGMVSWDIKFDMKRLVIIGIAGTFAAQIIRALPLRFGLHTILLMFVLLPMIYYMFKPPFWMASSATFGGSTLFLFVEEIVAIYILRVKGMHIQDMLDNLSLRAVYGLITPATLALYCVVFSAIRRLRRRRGAKRAPNSLV